jgi:hypothetical protein
MKYALEPLKDTALMKRLGDVPVFYDGVVNAMHLKDDEISLDLTLKAMHNPRFSKDTRVRVLCHGVKKFSLQKTQPNKALFYIHDFDIKRLDDGLWMRIENAEGVYQDITFTTIEMHEKTGL